MSDAAQISEPQVEKKTEDVSANGVNVESKEGGEPEVVSKSKHKRKKSKAKKAAAAAAVEASVQSAPPVPDVSADGEKSEDKTDDTPAMNADSEEVNETVTDAQTTESTTEDKPKKTLADMMAEGVDDSQAVKAVVDSEEPSTSEAPKAGSKDVVEVRHISHLLYHVPADMPSRLRHLSRSLSPPRTTISQSQPILRPLL